MAKLKAYGHAEADVDRGMAHLTGDHYREAEVEFSVTLPDGLEDEATNAIVLLMNREALRIAQVSAVNLRDQSVALEDAERLKDVPFARPVIIASPANRGTDPDRRKKPFSDPLTVQHFWRDEQGNLTAVDDPKKGADAKKKIERFSKAAHASPVGLATRKALEDGGRE